MTDPTKTPIKTYAMQSGSASKSCSAIKCDARTQVTTVITSTDKPRPIVVSEIVSDFRGTPAVVSGSPQLHSGHTAAFRGALKIAEHSDTAATSAKNPSAICAALHRLPLGAEYSVTKRSWSAESDIMTPLQAALSQATTLFQSRTAGKAQRQKKKKKKKKEKKKKKKKKFSPVSALSNAHSKRF
mmetsp:Transcript_3970/g.10929  ORF Transcript_3970/g.10929 Transcript_3970/m.10929 type:complete len:185 (+) Transcript_3970:1566-2120(+)